MWKRDRCSKRTSIDTNEEILTYLRENNTRFNAARSPIPDFMTGGCGGFAGRAGIGAYRSDRRRSGATASLAVDHNDE
jgi:hypothetical protein